MSIHEGHRERLRQRFLQSGLEGFAEHEMLELLLFYSRSRCDTNAIAHALLRRFGSLSAVMDAPLEELEAVEGMGRHSAMLLKLVPPLGARYLGSRAAPGKILASTQKAGAYFISLFMGKTSEEVYLAALDDKRKVLRCSRISGEGIVNAVHIPVRRIVAEAVGANATGVILAHNHPGGVALPSIEDKQLTSQAFTALRLIQVQLIDHIIVADDDYVSMADSGFIEKLQQEGRML